MKLRGAAFALALLGACSRAGAAGPVSWSHAAEGLEVASLAVSSQLTAWAVRYDPDVYELGLSSAPQGLKVPTSLSPGWVAAINGGYFEPDLRPSGLLIEDGREVAPESGHHGALVLTGGRARLGSLRDAKATPGASALQAWPFLVEPDGTDGIHSDDHKLTRRSAFGLDARGRGLLVAVPVEGVSLYQLMKVCQRLGAVVAVNLDGGPSTGFALAVPPGWSSPSETEVSNALVLKKRAAKRDSSASGLGMTR